MAYFDQILHTYTFQHCQDTGMQNYDKDLLSISLTGHAQFVKMLIILTLERHEFCLLIHFKMVFGNVVCGCSLAVTSTGPGGLMALRFYVREQSQAQPAEILVLKCLRRWATALSLIRQTGRARNRTETPG